MEFTPGPGERRTDKAVRRRLISSQQSASPTTFKAADAPERALHTLHAGIHPCAAINLRG